MSKVLCHARNVKRKRKILNPSSEVLTQAEAVPIKDEWGPPRESVIRGMQVINLEDGSPVVLLDENDVDFE